jgi:hypothetical protein
LEEFTHKFWGPNQLYTHHLGKTLINGRDKTPEVKLINLAMLTFAESPGGHQFFVLDVSCNLSWGYTGTRSASGSAADS